MSNVYVLNLHEVDQTKVAIVGGKEANLGELPQAAQCGAVMPSSASDCVRVLSIDGGGTRGLIPAVLAHLEEIAGRPAATLFHVIGGTSTGGILALGLTVPSANAAPAFSAAELAQLYPLCAVGAAKGRQYHFPSGIPSLVYRSGLVRRRLLALRSRRVADRRAGRADVAAHTHSYSVQVSAFLTWTACWILQAFQSLKGVDWRWRVADLRCVDEAT